MSDQPPHLERVPATYVHTYRRRISRETARAKQLKAEIQLFVAFMIGFAIGLTMIMLYAAQIK